MQEVDSDQALANRMMIMFALEELKDYIKGNGEKALALESIRLIHHLIESDAEGIVSTAENADSKSEVGRSDELTASMEPNASAPDCLAGRPDAKPVTASNKSLCKSFALLKL